MTPLSPLWPLWPDRLAGVFLTFWWVGAAGLGQLILAFSVGPKIRQWAERCNFYTLGDFLEHRFDRRVRALSAGLLWLGSLSILSGQLIGVAWILNVVTGAPKPVGCLIGGVAVTAYYTVGGLLSSAWVNVAQLLVKLCGFGLALPLALAAVGGWSGLTTRLTATVDDPAFLSWIGIGGSGIWGYLVLLVPPFIVSPGLIQKIYGVRDTSTVQLGTALNGLVLICFSFVPVLLGMVAAASFPGLTDRELALPTVMIKLLPTWVGALALAAIFSAELSSADAVLFMLSTSWSKDLYQSYLRPDAGDQELFRVGRWTALLAGGLGVLLAMLLPTVIAALTIFYGLVTVAFFGPVIAGLYTRSIGPPAALWSIGLSVPFYVGTYWATSGQGCWGLTPVSWGLLASVGVLLIASSRRQPRPKSI